jgi:hypothetical protein
MISPPSSEIGSWSLRVSDLAKQVSAPGLGRVKRENVKLPLEAHSSYRQSVDGNAQVPVPGATSEKFILGIFLLDAFLHSQGHALPSRSPPATGGFLQEKRPYSAAAWNGGV